MRRLLLGFTLSLGLLTSAWAQAPAYEGNWFGVASGYPLWPSLYYGFDDLFAPSADLRLGVGLRGFHYPEVGSGVSGTALLLGTSLLFQLPIEVSDLKVYGGAGLELGLGGGFSGDVGLPVLVFIPEGLLGLEVRLDAWGLFAEAQLGVASFVSPASFVRLTPALRLGAAYHFGGR